MQLITLLPALTLATFFSFARSYYFGPRDLDGRDFQRELIQRYADALAEAIEDAHDNGEGFHLDIRDPLLSYESYGYTHPQRRSLYPWDSDVSAYDKRATFTPSLRIETGSTGGTTSAAGKSTEESISPLSPPGAGSLGPQGSHPDVSPPNSPVSPVGDGSTHLGSPVSPMTPEPLPLAGQTLKSSGEVSTQNLAALRAGQDRLSSQSRMTPEQRRLVASSK